MRQWPKQLSVICRCLPFFFIFFLCCLRIDSTALIKCIQVEHTIRKWRHCHRQFFGPALTSRRRYVTLVWLLWQCQHMDGRKCCCCPPVTHVLSISENNCNSTAIRQRIISPSALWHYRHSVCVCGVRARKTTTAPATYDAHIAHTPLLIIFYVWMDGYMRWNIVCLSSYAMPRDIVVDLCVFFLFYFIISPFSPHFPFSTHIKRKRENICVHFFSAHFTYFFWFVISLLSLSLFLL